jgi:tRNA-splicing ligase RtcB
MRVVEGRIPIRIWARRIAEDALRQLHRVAELPFVVEAVCAMPDVHLAHGVAVGTVFATHEVVVPGALGGDLGCGISAVCVGARELDLERTLDEIARAVPVGDDVHRPRELPPDLLAMSVSSRALDRTRRAIGGRHLGTLGGGNHFLEIDRDVDGDLWILVHSGSRGIGAAIAERHRSATRGALEPAHDGEAFLRDLDFALAFAAANRREILRRALAVVGDATSEIIDIDHNHVRREDDRLVHRKGAIAAYEGARAIIPGSMGTASYVVEGRGHEPAFRSASHGAGRVISRTEARKRLPRARAEQAVRHVVHRVRGELVEEAPQVYRDIREVLEDEADLVTPLLRLEPLAVLKG